MQDVLSADSCAYGWLKSDETEAGQLRRGVDLVTAVMRHEGCDLAAGIEAVMDALMALPLDRAYRLRDGYAAAWMLKARPSPAETWRPGTPVPGGYQVVQRSVATRSGFSATNWGQSNAPQFRIEQRLTWVGPGAEPVQHQTMTEALETIKTEWLARVALGNLDATSRDRRAPLGSLFAISLVDAKAALPSLFGVPAIAPVLTLVSNEKDSPAIDKPQMTRCKEPGVPWTEESRDLLYRQAKYLAKHEGWTKVKALDAELGRIWGLSDNNIRKIRQRQANLEKAAESKSGARTTVVAGKRR
jgi:hypothetical protein